MNGNEERRLYGGRGQGSLIRFGDSAYWYSSIFYAGREVRESTKETDFKKARQVHKARLDKLGSARRGHETFPTQADRIVSVGELLDAYEADVELRGLKSAATVKCHLVAVRAALSAERALNLSAEAVDAYIGQRDKDGKAPATINRETHALGAALRLAVERGRLRSAPKIRRLREDNAREGFFERGDFEAVVKHLPDYLRDFARFAFFTGWRRGELVSLTWADVDREGGVVRLRGSESKNGRGRTAALEGDLVGLIERRWQARLITGRDGAARVTDLVFHRGGRLIRDFRGAWEAACASAGLTRPRLDKGGQPILDKHGKPLTRPARLFHDLRRTAVRNAVRAGVPERVAMQMSGHVTRSVFDRYNIVSEADLRSAMRKTSEYVNALPAMATVTPLVAVNGGAR